MKKCVILSDDEYTALVSLLNDAAIDIRKDGAYYRECAFENITRAKNILKGEGDHLETGTTYEVVGNIHDDKKLLEGGRE